MGIDKYRCRCRGVGYLTIRVKEPVEGEKCYPITMIGSDAQIEEAKCFGYTHFYTRSCPGCSTGEPIKKPVNDTFDRNEFRRDYHSRQ